MLLCFQDQQLLWRLLKTSHHLLLLLVLIRKQQKQFKTFREADKAKLKELKEAMKENRHALRDELKTYDTDTSAINSTVAKMKTLQSEMIDLRVASFLQMKKILTPEQYEKLQEMKGQRKSKRSGRHGRKNRKGAGEDF